MALPTWLEPAERKGNALILPLATAGLLGLVSIVVVLSNPQCEPGGRFEPERCGPNLTALLLVSVFAALRVVSAIAAHRLLRTRRVHMALGGARGLANGAVVLGIALVVFPTDVAQICTSAGVCFTPRGFAAVAALLVAAGTFALNALRKPETREATAKDDAPILEDEDATRNVVRDLAIPLALLLALAIAAILYWGGEDNRGLVLSGALGFVALRAAGRLVYYLKKPATFYPVVVGVLRGAAIATFGVLSVLEFVPEGPGMPLTAWQLGLFILCVSFLRQHKTLVKGPGLPILASLLVAIGAGAWGGYNAYRYLIGSLPLPFTGQFLWLFAVLYAVLCVRALLGFAGHDEAGKSANWLEWLRANFWRNLVFVGLLVAYLAFRNDMARGIPFFPIVEFSIGLFVLGAVLARVRGRIRATLSEKPVSAQWKRHEQVVDKIPEVDTDAVHGALGSFLRDGAGREEYAKVFARAAHLEGEAAAAFVEPVRSFRETRRWYHLPYAAIVAAAVLVAVGAILALRVLILNNAEPGTTVAGIWQLACLVAALAVFSTQNAARRSESVLNLAACGALSGGLVATGLVGYLLLGFGSFFEAPWPILALIAVFTSIAAGIPGYRAWRLSKAIAANTLERAPGSRAERARAGVRSQSKALVAYVVTGFLITVPASVVLSFLVERDVISPGFREAYAIIQGPLLVLLGALTLASLALLAGYLVARPFVTKEETANREARAELHARMMKALEEAPTPVLAATSPSKPPARAPIPQTV